ncbi:MAG: hypothetical protein D3924_00875 [Candidatus Electrothrix sp. AR4]|nr:hypothetical protein [Candidatus Electrothrix sp. AR4]
MVCENLNTYTKGEFYETSRRRGFEGVVTLAALKAVRSWRFTPGTVGVNRKKMWVKVSVWFQLK